MHPKALRRLFESPLHVLCAKKSVSERNATEKNKANRRAFFRICRIDKISYNIEKMSENFRHLYANLYAYFC